jgi:hypothetical protein
MPRPWLHAWPALQRIHGDLPPRPGASTLPSADGCSSTSRENPCARWPSGASRISPHETSPACCGPSTTPPGRNQLSQPETTAAAQQWATQCQAAYLAGYGEGGGPQTLDALVARRPRAGQSRLRGPLRSPQPSDVAADPSCRRRPSHEDAPTHDRARHRLDPRRECHPGLPGRGRHGLPAPRPARPSPRARRPDASRHTGRWRAASGAASRTMGVYSIWPTIAGGIWSATAPGVTEHRWTTGCS